MYNHRQDDIMKLALCDRAPQPHIICTKKISKLFHPKCVSDLCTNCGNISMSKCPTHSQYTEITKSVLWQEAERAGDKTQLETVENNLPMNEINTKLEESAEVGRKSYVLGQWNDHMRKIYCEESEQATTVILTDFYASFDLRVRQTDKCSVNNHTVLEFFYLLNNFRKLRLDNAQDACICDTYCFCYFGYSISSGKKMIMHFTLVAWNRR